MPPENTTTMRMFSKEEIKELFAETDKRMNRLAASQEKTDEQLAKNSRDISELRESQKKTDAQLANLGVKMDKMNERYGGVSNNIGRASEQLFFNILCDWYDEHDSFTPDLLIS